jgi:GDP-L-fucose synthase
MDMEKNYKIYVAGHNGLVGSAIVKNLKQRGYANLVFRTSSELDLRKESDVASFFAAEKPDYVFLAAARVGGIVANNTYRGQFIYENLAIQNNVIHQSYLAGVKKLLFLGSTCIYPKNAPQPMPEDCLLTSPLEYTNEPYAIAKIAGIKMCESYNIQYGTDFISVMPTNLYGPNDNFNLEKSHMLPALVRKIYLGKCLETGNWEQVRKDMDSYPIEGCTGSSSTDEILAVLAKYGVKTVNGLTSVGIWGTGAPMRELLWSEDMADACVFVMENVSFKDLTVNCGSEIRNTHINIGTGRDLSIEQHAELIKKIVGFAGKLVFDSSKPDGTMKKLTDTAKINSLGWKHKVEIEEGVGLLYNWYLDTLDNNL